MCSSPRKRVGRFMNAVMPYKLDQGLWRVSWASFGLRLAAATPFCFLHLFYNEGGLFGGRSTDFFSPVGVTMTDSLDDQGEDTHAHRGYCQMEDAASPSGGFAKSDGGGLLPVR